jgi:predicted XRE-type DNA-binding protein
MKITSVAKRAFVGDLNNYMAKHNLGVTGIARITGVHQSQVSRLALGQFKNVSSNVIKICIELGFDIAKYRFNPEYDEVRARLANDAFAIWDGTPEDADAVGSLLRDIARLRKGTHAKS